MSPRPAPSEPPVGPDERPVRPDEPPVSAPWIPGARWRLMSPVRYWVTAAGLLGCAVAAPWIDADLDPSDRLIGGGVALAMAVWVARAAREASVFATLDEASIQLQLGPRPPTRFWLRDVRRVEIERPQASWPERWAVWLHLELQGAAHRVLLATGSGRRRSLWARLAALAARASVPLDDPLGDRLRATRWGRLRLDTPSAVALGAIVAAGSLLAWALL